MVDCQYEEKACYRVPNEGIWNDALFSRHGGGVECKWNFPGTREIYGRDPEEVRDDGLQGHNRTYGSEPEAID